MDPFPEAAPLVQQLLRQALSAGATGLYLTTTSASPSARICVAGRLQALPQPDPLKPALRRIRYMAAKRSDPGHFRRGHFFIKLKQLNLRVMVRVFSTTSTAGEKLTMRFELDEPSKAPADKPRDFDESFGPSFFIGVVNAPALRGEVIPPRDGLRHFNHQCDGHSCSQRQLYGLLLPISTCPDADIRRPLDEMARTFKGYQGDFPIAQLRPALHSATEAFIPMMNLSVAFDWLNSNGFRYIDDDTPAGSESGCGFRTRPLGDTSLSRIINELKAQKVLSDSSELTIAFVYFNSD